MDKLTVLLQDIHCVTKISSPLSGYILQASIQSVTFNIHYNKVEPPRYVGIPHNLIIEVEQVEM